MLPLCRQWDRQNGRINLLVFPSLNAELHDHHNWPMPSLLLQAMASRGLGEERFGAVGRGAKHEVWSRIQEQVFCVTVTTDFVSMDYNI